jgi:2-polyprenyl-3-methyl-5-hydroxy-6-metoxy-1,4-benzoquinol methylase
MINKLQRLWTRIRRASHIMFWWVGAPAVDDDVWNRKQELEILQNGDSLRPDPGILGDREYIHKHILDYYGSFEGLITLGAGCGTGRIEAWLASEGARVICLDNSKEAIQVSRIHAERAVCQEHFVVGDLERMPFRDQKFDCIYSGGVLEHFVDPKPALREYFRVTKPQGVIIISVPNLVGLNAAFGLKPLLEPLLKRNREAPYTEKDFSSKNFRKLIQQSGFECLDISPTFFNSFDLFPFRYMRGVLSFFRVYDLYCRLLQRLGKRFPGIAFGYSFMIAFAQRPE